MCSGTLNYKQEWGGGARQEERKLQKEQVTKASFAALEGREDEGKERKESC